MKMSKLGILAAAVSALIVSAGAFASDAGMSATGFGPGGDNGGGTVTGGTGCFYSYYIRKIGDQHPDRDGGISYKIFVKNLGNCDLHHIRVVDLLPDHTELVYATPGFHPVDHRIVWDDVSLEEGDKAVFEVKVRVKHDCDDNVWITNTGCAFTPLIGTRICDSASVWFSHDHHGDDHGGDSMQPGTGSTLQ